MHNLLSNSALTYRKFGLFNAHGWLNFINAKFLYDNGAPRGLVFVTPFQLHPTRIIFF